MRGGSYVNLGSAEAGLGEKPRDAQGGRCACTTGRLRMQDKKGRPPRPQARGWGERPRHWRPCCQLEKRGSGDTRGTPVWQPHHKSPPASMNCDPGTGWTGAAPSHGIVPPSSRKVLAQYFSYLDTVWLAKWATSWGSPAGEYLDLLTQRPGARVSKRIHRRFPQLAP